MLKDTEIRIRINSREKKQVKKIAQKKGFSGMSAYIYYLLRQSMKVIVLIAFIGLSGCATASFLPANSYQAYPSTQSVQILNEKPEKPYIELGAIIMEGEYLSSLYEKLKIKAMKLGANAVIIKSTSAREEASFSWFGSLQRLEGLAIRWKE